MSDTIRELIIQSLIARAAVMQITSPSTGYYTDIGETVLRARPKVDPDELPCSVVWPQVEEAENKHGMSLHKMPVRIEGMDHFGAADPSVVSEKILGDLIKCFTSPSWDRRRLVASPASPVTYLQPYAESIVYIRGGISSYPDDKSTTVGSIAEFIVAYWTAIGNPYGQ